MESISTVPTSGTVSVAADGSGDYPSLADAVAAAESGTTIVLGAGEFALPAPLDGLSRWPSSAPAAGARRWWGAGRGG